MARITCEYCGTEYDANMRRCPLCGTINEAVEEDDALEIVQAAARRRKNAQPPRRQQPARREEDEDDDEDEDDEEEQAPRRRAASARRRKPARAADEDRIPRWLTIVICVVLGIAVVIGALYALYSLGAFDPKKDDTSQDPSLDLPLTDDNGQGEQQPAPETNEPVVTPPADTRCVSISALPSIVRLAEVNDTMALTVTVVPADCTEPVQFSSSDETVCTVDANGVITAVDGGAATVQVVCGTARTEVEVNCDFSNSRENNASLSTTDFTLFSVGEKTTLTILDPPRDAEITWTSSNTAVCTVTDGVVTATGGGTATITAKVNDRELTCTARCNIPGYVPAGPGNAENPPAANRLDHDDVTLGVGESFEISVVNGVSGGWNVSDGSVISVDGNGNVTALASGIASVYTIIGGERLSCTVRVK